MKQVKVDDLTYEMLKDVSKRKDALGLAATLAGFIRGAYEEKKKKNG